MGATGSMAPLYASMGVSALGSVGTAVSQAGAIKAKGAYDQSVAETNARIAGLEETQTLEAGDIAASRKNLETSQKVGELKAIQGASGTDVASGSNVLVRGSEELAGRTDEMTIRTNAARRAWGYKVSAIQDTYQAQFTRMAAANQAQQTILSGGMQAISGPLAIESSYLRWARYMGGGGGTRGGTPYDLG